jgi:steroid 5-alpha reductase family enzyme
MIEFVLSSSKTVVASSSFMLIIWLVYLAIRKPTIILPAWAIGIAIIANTYSNFFPNTGFTYTILGLVYIWTIKVIIFSFFTKMFSCKEDERFLEIKHFFHSNEIVNYFAVFQVQAVVMSIVAAPLYLVFQATSDIGFLFILGILIAATGILGGAISDFILYRFKKHHPRTICDKAFWHYSRHPNYFFEIITWTGFTIACIKSFGHILLFISPILLYAIIDKISIPLTEKLMAKKYTNFKEYKRSTNRLLIISKDRLKSFYRGIWK